MFAGVGTREIVDRPLESTDFMQRLVQMTSNDWFRHFEHTGYLEGHIIIFKYSIHFVAINFDCFTGPCAIV